MSASEEDRTDDSVLTPDPSLAIPSAWRAEAVRAHIEGGDSDDSAGHAAPDRGEGTASPVTALPYAVLGTTDVPRLACEPHE